MLVSSKEYVYVPVDAPARVGDVTQYPVEVALIPAPSPAETELEPEEGDWHDAEWIDGEAALLAGPGAPVSYPAGEYMAFARVTAGVERPVLRGGRWTIGL